MAHDRGLRGQGKSVVVTFRLEKRVHDKLKRLHPEVSEYLRDRVTYDVTRSHTKKKRNPRKVVKKRRRA